MFYSNAQVREFRTKRFGLPKPSTGSNDIIDSVLSGRAWPFAGGPLSSIRNFPVAKIDLNPTNEDALRRFLFEEWWSPRWPRIRQKHKASGTKSRYTASKRPVDLSGGCILANMVAGIVFYIDTEWHWNASHAFNVFPDGTVYDINRDCNDVQRMWSKGRNPYRLTYEHLAKPDSPASWHTALAQVLLQWREYVKHISLDCDVAEPYKTCPTWALPGQRNP